ncbi:MAG TPA: hypothetical protein VEI06_09760, partial [Gemmatimonadaceae bacterium]|nr:hypothetical protein [Gemmatimonadaceae bacterium]
FDAPAGFRQTLPPFAALDVSASWLRGGDSTAWRTALGRARRLRAESLFVFGDSVRGLAVAQLPRDLATRGQPLAQRAQSAGRPLIIITDGELDDPASVGALPAGSRLDVIAHRPGIDAGVVAVDAPRSAVEGDTMEVRTTVRAGDTAIPRAKVSILVGGKTLASVDVDSLAARAERSLAIRVPVAAPLGPSTLAAAVQVSGDVEPRNDTVVLPIDIARAAGAVLVSTSPDFDARFVLPVLRGAVALPTRAYFRVAPGAWRQDGSLGAVTEATVRGALRDAPLAIIHGDTSYFGAPRSATTGSIVLMVPATDTIGEWYAVAAPQSPIAGALAGIAWDSLPPLAVSGRPSGTTWEGLTVARARQLERRPIVTGRQDGRRMAIVSGSGFWRWRFRGGASADAFSTLWGALFDWLVAERSDPRAALPAEGVVREGDRIRWRRGNTDDTVVVARLRARNGSRDDSLTLHFPRGVTMAESDPLPAGLYDVTVKGGTAVLAVNASRELLPRSVTVRPGMVGGAPATGDAPSLRDRGWPFLLLLALLCAEWIARRRVGLR